MSAERLMIAHSLEPLQPGGDFTEWPHHITVVPWFSTGSEDIGQLVRVLDSQADRIRPFTVTAGDEDRFGPEGDVMVRKIADPKPLQYLHLRLLRTIEHHGLGRLIDDTYAGERYSPHVTRQSEAWPQIGDRIEINGVTLIQKGKPTKRVVGNMAFRGWTRFD